MLMMVAVNFRRKFGLRRNCQMMLMMMEFAMKMKILLGYVANEGNYGASNELYL